MQISRDRCVATVLESVWLKLHMQRLQKSIQRGLAAGRTVEEVMRELDSH